MINPFNQMELTNLFVLTSLIDDISMAEPENIDLMTFDDAPNLSLGEQQNHLSKRIEELVETSLRETLETLENENGELKHLIGIYENYPF